MNTVIAVLREYITDRNVRFVFPSQTSAGLWARKTCTLGIARSIESNRFVAWDRFKENIIREKDTKKEPASALVRKLFAEALIRKNAESVSKGGRLNAPGDFPFRSLIPPEFAEGGKVFTSFIARLLPSLSHWEKLLMKKRQAHPAPDGNNFLDGEDRDYALLKKEYTAFLERHNFFEPSWEEIELKDENARYVLFFPELIEDFAEYDGMLQAPQFIRIKSEPDNEQVLLCYESAREEIRAAVTEIRRLHEEEGIPYEDMALSVPELEEMEPCLLREFYLHRIPVTRRAGKELGETGVGRFFSLVNEYAASRFSFNSLKALLLNDHIPWKEREKNRALINFGIKYNCVSGYTQNGKTVDIWEEAFKEGYNDGGRELRPYYDAIKRRVLALAGSGNFREIRKFYFAFRSYPSGGKPEADGTPAEIANNGLLDMANISAEDDAVLSRCIEELGSLIEMEEKLNDPALVPSSPFAFFLSSLGEIEYVRAGQKPGVNIFKWRVAAASPFSCHFVLNASQNAASVIYRPMKFLRQDKRKALGIEDTDATGAFFLLCGTGEDKDYKPRIRISVSAQTFSGWAIPHCFFTRDKTVKAPPCGEDPYGAERRFWRDAEKNSGAAQLSQLYPLQKRSFDLWKNTLAQRKNNFSFFDGPVPGTSPAGDLLKNACLDGDGLLTVSPTRDLNVYYNCPVSWLYARIFRAEEFSLEAALLDDTSLGILYHVILEELFARIKDEDRVFDKRRLDTYKRWTLEITKAAIKKHPAFKGPLAVPLVSPQAAGMSGKIAGLLDLEAKFFDGYRIAELELPVSFKNGDLCIKGVIDRVSISPNGEPVIMDYKTTYLPEQTGSEELEDAPLSEFQMPLYIKLYEEISGAGDGPGRVRGACFYSINERKIKAAMGDQTGGRNKAPDREEYEAFLGAAERQIKEFGQKVKALDLAPEQTRLGVCGKCIYKTACRRSYFLNADTGAGKKEG